VTRVERVEDIFHTIKRASPDPHPRLRGDRLVASP
jgi:hypothetical protein